MMPPRLILASSSSYRGQLLKQLGLRFESINPDVDETPVTQEDPSTLSLRLGYLKAEAVLSRCRLKSDTDNYLVIGSDQVCHLDNQAYSKPGNNETAIRHLQAFSGRWVTFSTSLVLLNSSGERKDHVEDFRILFRRLTLAEIEYYVALDQPLDCAGAIKVEKAGVSLLSDTRGRDINSLYGLPLIALCDGFAELGYSIKDFN